jgi:hypothetical protein
MSMFSAVTRSDICNIERYSDPLLPEFGRRASVISLIAIRFA